MEMAPGIYALDHTADVGLELYAGSLPGLFERAAQGMLLLARGEDLGAPPEPIEAPAGGADDGGAAAGRSAPVARSLELRAADTALLLVDFLRELLWWYQSEQLAHIRSDFGELAGNRLAATVFLDPDSRPPVREIKGVTYHGLAVERGEYGWHGRVIFDV